jgi:type II secretory pathway pseudopilin PulG
MNCRSRFESPASRRAPAFTLAELLVAVGLGSVALTAIMMLWLYSSRSFVAMGNYMDLDKASRNALDQMSREIRQTIALQSYATNQLVFVDYDTNLLSFTWNPSTRQVTRAKGGSSKVLLAQCDYLTFKISQRNPIPGLFDFYAATNNASLCKLVDVSWRCSRTIFGKKVNTESVQTAKIVLRN